ncbi:UNVERIFIED_CONTAM: hypothetical protein FKN15_023578 [Acipenser sinensis]
MVAASPPVVDPFLSSVAGPFAPEMVAASPSVGDHLFYPVSVAGSSAPGMCGSVALKGAGEGEAEDDDEGREDGFLSGLFRRVTLQLSLGTEPSGQDVATFFTDDGGEPCPEGAGEGEAEDDDEGREDGFLSGLFRRVTLQLSLGTEPSGQDVATFFTDDGGEPCPGGMAMEHAAEL